MISIICELKLFILSILGYKFIILNSKFCTGIQVFQQYSDLTFASSVVRCTSSGLVTFSAH